MRILILSTDYERFIRAEYAAHPGMETAPYSSQYRFRNESLFGTADFYSSNLRQIGHDAEEIYVNNRWLQYAWAREHGMDIDAPAPPSVTPDETAPQVRRASPLVDAAKSVLRPLARKVGVAGMPRWEASILRRQIEVLRPDIILNQSVDYVGSEFLKKFRKPGRLIIGQIASPLPQSENYSAYDFMISSLPNFVTKFRAQKVPAALNRLAFETSLLEKLSPAPARDIPLSFVGSLSPDHAKRIEWLEYMATHTPVKVWGTGIERLARSSPLWNCYQGEAWGRGMYDVLRRSHVTLNLHIDLAENMANNMRLFEATGMATALLTDQKENLSDLFIPGEHLLAYRSPEDCANQALTLLSDKERAAAIGLAGQRHVLAHHSYLLRVKEIMDLVDLWRTSGPRAFL
ncbi:MAG TPA: glycosyltransferase [Rhizomicrobium sp.]|nr:glycosyltransferase [Rhizomicrobium sp.]